MSNSNNIRRFWVIWFFAFTMPLFGSLVAGQTSESLISPRRIVVFGDSTSAARLIDSKPLRIYADILRDEAKLWGIEIVNAGIPGNTTSDALQRLDKDILSQKPDLVIIQFGINDAAVDVWKKPPVAVSRVSLSNYVANLQAMISRVRNLGGNVILMTPNPTRWTPKLIELYGKPPYVPTNPDGFNVVLKDYAQAVRNLAAEQSIVLVDVYAEFQVHGAHPNHSVDEFLADGMHPNDAGHLLIAGLLREQLAKCAAKAGHAEVEQSSMTKTASGMELDARAKDLPGFKMGPFVKLPDGRWLTIEHQECCTSTNRGVSWQSNPVFKEPARYFLSDERVIIRTREGVLIAAFMNNVEKHWTWSDQLGDAPGAVLPNYVMRSLDEGKTWEEPVKLHDDWTGAVREIIQTKSGRVIFTSMKMRHDPGHHTVLTYCSDDWGKTWRASNVIDLGGAGNHDGVTEAAMVELKDGRIVMWLRTNWGKFWTAESKDDGLNWKVLGPGELHASASPALLRRLQSGKIVVLWNQEFPEGKQTYPLAGGDRIWSASPGSIFRGELSMAFSDDDCKTWSRPIVIARKQGDKVRLSYPFLFEPEPGSLLITSMQGEVRMSLQEPDFCGGAK